MSLLVIGLIFIVGIMVITLGGALVTTWLTNQMIGSKHIAIDEIMQNGEPPTAWRKPFERKIAKLRQEPGNDERIAQVQAQARATYLKKLDNLNKYVYNSRLVGSEEARREIQEEFAKVRENWSKG